MVDDLSSNISTYDNNLAGLGSQCKISATIQIDFTGTYLVIQVQYPQKYNSNPIQWTGISSTYANGYFLDGGYVGSWTNTYTGQEITNSPVSISTDSSKMSVTFSEKLDKTYTGHKLSNLFNNLYNPTNTATELTEAWIIQASYYYAGADVLAIHLNNVTIQSNWFNTSSLAPTITPSTTEWTNSNVSVNISNTVTSNNEGTKLWNKDFGGGNNDYFNSIIQTSDGGFVTAGYSQSSDGDETGLNKGNNDAIIVKYDSNGNKLWNKNFGGSNDDRFYSVTQTSDSGFVVVGYSESSDGDEAGLNKGIQNAIIVKYDSNGNKLWNKNFGGSRYDYFQSVVQTSDGGYITVGFSSSTDGDETGLNKGNNDAIIVKYDSNGNKLWNKNFGGSNYDCFNSIIQTSDGGYVTVGTSNSIYGNASVDAIIVKYDSNGNKLWNKNFGGSNYDCFNSIIQTSDGGYVTVGTSYSIDGDEAEVHKGNDAIIVKYDSNGNKLWNKNFGGISNGDYFNLFNSIIQTSDGGYVTVGNSNSPDGDEIGLNKGNTDAIIVKYDTNGNKLWNKNFGGTGLDNFNSIIQTSDGGYVTVGNSTSADGDEFEFRRSYSNYTNAIIAKYSSLAFVQYQIDGGTWTNYIGTITISDEGIHTINARTNDGSGNLSPISTTIVRIDKTNPGAAVITPSTVNWTNNDVTISINNGTDTLSGATKSQYQIDNDTWADYTNIITVTTEGIHTINAKTFDKAGNVSSISSTIVKIDKTSSGAPTITPSTVNWTNNDVTISINNGTDTLSGATKSQYQIDNDTWADYTNIITVTTEGIHTINAKTFDKAGNVSSISSTIVKIDKTSPGAPTITPSTVNWTNNDVTISINDGTDALSGAAKSQCQIDGGTWTDYTNIITVTDEGIHTINAKTFDKAGNVSSISSTIIKIDKTSPGAPTITPSTVNWTNNDVTISINDGTDALSGVAKSQYQLDSGIWTDYTSIITVTDEGIHTINAKTFDKVGNVSSISSTIIKIDKTAPNTPAINPSAASSVNSITFTLNGISDELSGTAKSQYQLDSGTWNDYSSTVTINSIGTHIINAKVIDNAGNVSTMASTTVIISIPPAPTITPSTTEWTNSNVSVNISDTVVRGNKLWNKNFGGSTNDYFYSVIQTSDGGYAAIGSSNSTDGDEAGLKKGNNDAIIVKYDANCNKVWNKNFGGSTNDYFRSITQTSDGGFIAVGSSDSNDGDEISLNKGTTDAIIVKYDSNGNKLWNKNFGGSNSDYFRSIIQTSDGGFIAVGNSNSTDGDEAGLNKGANDAIIVKYDSSAFTQYQIDGGNWTTYTNTITISAEGIHTINARTNNGSGNLSPVSTAAVKIDKTNPGAAVITPSTVNWTNNDVTISINDGTDALSGAAKSQYQIDNGTWIDYTGMITITNEGIHTINAKTFDKAGNVSSISSTIVKIDKTSAAAVVNPVSYDGSRININYNTMPANAASVIHLNNIIDNLSGVSNVKVWFTKSSDTSNTVGSNYLGFDIASGTTDKDLSIQLPEDSIYGDNIHFQITDNAGNKSYFYGNIQLQILAPEVPAVSGIVNDKLYLKGENININWTYKDDNTPVLPQGKVDFIFTNVESNSVTTKTLEGTAASYQIPVDNIPDGITKVKVRVYNSGNKYSDSSEYTIRINRFNPNGKILTKTIELADSIQFASVYTDYVMPKNTSIKCILYYWNENASCFDENHKVILNIANKNALAQLPYSTNKFKIKYILTSTDIINVSGTDYAKVSPTITSCRLYGK